MLYKKLVDGTEKSVGTKNLSDNLKHCVSSQTTYGSTSSSSTEPIGTPSVTRTLDSFAKRSGKEVTTLAKDKIHERTAALVAAAYLPYRFVENTELDRFAQSFIEIEIGALFGNIPASDLIVSRAPVRRNIVNKSASIQDPAKYSAVSFVANLWTDNVVNRSYLDVTFFWVEESGID